MPLPNRLPTFAVTTSTAPALKLTPTSATRTRLAPSFLFSCLSIPSHSPVKVCAHRKLCVLIPGCVPTCLSTSRLHQVVHLFLCRNKSYETSSCATSKLRGIIGADHGTSLKFCRWSQTKRRRRCVNSRSSNGENCGRKLALKAPVPAVTNHKVQLSTFARVDVIPRRDSHARLPVLVRITVPAAAATTERRAPVDLVTLLDISYGGGGAAASKRLDLLRKAMDLVIGRLGAEDRLAIVPFHSSVTDPTGLLHMSVEGRCAASRKVQSLAVSGGTKLFPALNMAVQILEGRREEEKCREGFVILISDGDDRTIFRETIHPKYPVHAFGFRDAHDARAVHYVADHTSGVYAVLNDEHDRITDAFAACVRRVTSVVALEAQIDLTCGAYSRASLCAVENGHYKCHVEDNLRSGFIYAGSLCAGDVKNFLVYVDVDREDDCKDVTELLTVHGTYLDAPRRNDIVHLDERMAVVQRHDKIPDVSRDVAAELVRVETVKMVSGVLGKCNSYGKGLAGVVTELREGWCRIKISEDARAAGSASLAGLAREMEDMEASLLRCSGLSYMLSWLTRHNLQLHTAAASASPPSSCNKAAEVAALEHNACAIAAGDRHGKGSIAGTKRKCAEFDKIEERLAYWSKVKHDLPLMFLDAASPETSTGDHTTAVFRDASLETIDRAMFQDVYLAVLHASTVRRCTQQSCAPTSSEHSHDDHDD